MRDRVYRICAASTWDQVQTLTLLPLSELDRRDGYVHLSAARQVPGTLSRYFAGREDLVLLTLDCDRLVAGSLIFEAPSYGELDPRLGPPGSADMMREAQRLGLLFPHFHGRVPVTAIVRADPLPLDDAGQHCLPACITQAIEDERDESETIDLRAVWDPANELVRIEYPRPSRIDDEAGIYAWEATIEGRIGPLVEAHGPKLAALIGLDNLWIAAKLERRYVELAEKVSSRWFGPIARWTTQAHNHELFHELFARVDRPVPSRVFPDREQALAFLNETRGGLRSSA